MTTPRHRAVRAVLLAAVLLLLGAGHVRAQEPEPLNRVFLPLITHDTTCEVYPRLHVVFIEEPGLYYKVTPSDPTGLCPVMVFYRHWYTDENGNSQWGPTTGIGHVWVWMPRYSGGNIYHILQFIGVNYDVDLLFTRPLQ